MKNLLQILAFGLLMIASLQSSATDEVPASKDTIEIKSFIEQAFVMGIAEIESGKLALQKSNSDDVKKFAQKIIDEHTNSNSHLMDIAQQKNLTLPSQATATDQARKLSFNQAGSSGFDKAYANHETKNLTDTLALFNKASLSKDIDIAGFATAAIPKLKHQLQFAEQLSKTP